MILYFAAAVLLYALIFVSKTYDTPLIVSIIIIGILLSFGKHWLEKSESILITNKEKLFFAFYNTADGIENYLENKSNKENEKEARARLLRLANYVDKWTTKNTPESLAELPNSLSFHLGSFESLIREDTDKKLEQLKEKFENIAVESNDRLSEKTLKELDNSIKEFFPMPVSTTITFSHKIQKKFKILKPLKENSRWKFILIFMCSICLVILNEIFTPEDYSETVFKISMAGIGIAALLTFFYQRAKNESKSA